MTRLVDPNWLPAVLQAALTAAREAQPFALLVGSGGTEQSILDLAHKYHREYCKVRGMFLGFWELLPSWLCSRMEQAVVDLAHIVTGRNGWKVWSSPMFLKPMFLRAACTHMCMRGCSLCSSKIRRSRLERLA